MIRYTASQPCPVCGGHERLPRGRGTRCAGFVADDGKWARCEREQHAAGLELDPRTSPPTYLHRLDGPCRCGTEHGPASPGAAENGHAARATRPDPRRIVARYPYRDAAGRTLYRVARFNPKGFMPQHVDERGDWVPGYASDVRVLYRLPELLAARPAVVPFIVEGEKDADRLAGLGFVVTTNAGGAKSWAKHAATYAEPFRGRSVAVVIPDNDDDGRAWCAEVAASLAAVGCPARILDELPELPPKGDVSDWLDRGHTADELRALAAAPPASEVGTLLSDVQAEPVEWLWPGRLARGMVALVDGDPGLGKSSITLDIAARVTRGEAWPDGAPGLRGGGGVVVLTAEDSLAHTVRPRVEAAGGDASRIVALQVAGADEHEVTIPGDLAAVDAVIKRVSAVLVIVDPLMAYLGEDTNAHRDQDVRRALRPLAALAERTNVVVIVIRHLNKAQGAAVLYRGGGSIGIVGAARLAFLVGADPEDEDRRVLAPVKVNIGPKPPALAYRIVGADNGALRVVWEDGECSLTAPELLAPRAEEQPASASGRGKAVATVVSILAAGPVEAKGLRERVAEEAGVSPRTVDAAKRVLGVVSERAGFDDGKWYWRLPDCTSQPRAVERNPRGVATYDEPLRSTGDDDRDDREEILL